MHCKATLAMFHKIVWGNAYPHSRLAAAAVCRLRGDAVIAAARLADGTLCLCHDVGSDVRPWAAGCHGEYGSSEDSHTCAYILYTGAFEDNP